MLRALTVNAILASTILSSRIAGPFRGHSGATGFAASGGARLVVDTPPPDTSIDLDGYYFLTAPLPTWCADIDVLTLLTIEADYSNGDSTRPRIKRVPLWGFIRLKRPSGGHPVDFRLKDIVLRDHDFSFSTIAVDSVSYQFTGRFRRVGNFHEDPPQGIVLVGHLQKRRSGKVLYEGEVQYIWSGGD